MELLTADKAIAALEDYVIYPNIQLAPTLGVIINESAPVDDLSYLKSIRRKADVYNVVIKLYECENFIEASHAIAECKHDPRINGIIILSSFGNKDTDRALANMIPTRLDLDCMASHTMGMLVTSQSPVGYRFGPCAPVAAMKLLEYEGLTDLSGLKVAILSRSLRVGRPLAEMLTQHNATVTCIHSQSNFYLKDLRDYDIIISAMGQLGAIKGEYFEPNHGGYIIDISINVDENGKLCGDCDIDSFKDIDIHITPVPGCVGKLATTVLFSKLFTNAAHMRGDTGV